MSKVKSGSKAAKPAKSDVLSKVKDAAVAKPAQKTKSKSKEVAKAAVTKEEKKSKKSKKVKEPTPEPESDSEESESEESESSSEDEAAPPAVATNGKKAANSNDDSDSDSSEDDAPAANGVLGKAPAVTEVDSDDSDSSDEESEEDTKPAKSEKATKAAKPAKAESSDEDSDDSDSDDETPAAKKAEPKDDSDSDDSSDESEEEVEKKPVANKRKAETEAEPAAKKTKTEATATEGQGGNLFVGSLSWNIDDAWLREVFEEHGEVSRAQVMTDRATGRSKGFGYVEFTSADDAAKAHAAKQGFELDGRTINVDFANSRPAKSDQTDRRKSYGDQVSEPSDTLFLGNLSFDVGQETVTEAFSPHGTIMGIRLPTDRETGEPKGFGYVTFASIDEAKAALEAMQGAYISSRPVRLDYSQPRPQNDAGGRGGGRGGFGGGRGRGGDRGGRGRGGFGGGRGRGGFDRGGRGGGRGGRGGSTNRGGFGDFSGNKVSFD